ncbi:uncharacterized protein LOC124814829 [Hydra vulgaris]|uniref:uncharacterized protein LOC124814829 n=1 Tax=Hydra vulgaris TaxID=6087 RepID=UPI0032EA2F15
MDPSRNLLDSKICELLPKDFDKVAHLIGNSWQSFGRQLGLTNHDLEHIKSDNSSTLEKAVCVLSKWKQNHVNPSWEILKTELTMFQRLDIIKEIEKVLADRKFSKDKKNNNVRRIPYGGIFKFDLHEDISCTLVEFKRHNVDHWMSINNKKQLDPYYLTRKKNNEMFVKVENLISISEMIYFKFSFQGSKKGILPIECLCNITGNCSYELYYKNIIIAAPELFFNNEFSKNIRTPNSLDWRETANIVLDKVPHDQSIELIADNYMDRNFSDLADVICVCPSSSGKSYITLVLEKFYKLFSTNKTGVCAIIPGYHLRHHAYLLKCNVENIRSCKDEDRIILFHSELNLILIIRIATSLARIPFESENCLNDIVLFININSLYIEANKLVVLGIIVLPTYERKELNEELFFLFSETWREEKDQSNEKEQELKQILFLCKDDMEDENINQWWRSVAAYCFGKYNNKSNNSVFFKKLIGLTMIVMAAVDKVNFPTIHFDPQKQINTLLLNNEQREAIYSMELKKIITGGYGSGKSIVGKEIVKNCITKMSENPLTLYYICCNHFSLFQCEIKEFVDRVKKAPNVTVVCDNLYELWKKMHVNEDIKNDYISIPKLLEYLVVINTNKVYFVLDELSSDYVKEEDAIQFNILFSSALKESLVVFIPESVGKNRMLIKNNKKCLIQKYYFNEEALDMKVFTLSKSMRVTRCNKLLIDSSQDSICESKTVCNFPNSIVDKISPNSKNDSFENKHSRTKENFPNYFSSTEYKDESILNDIYTVVENLSDLGMTNDKKFVYNPPDENHLSNTKVVSTIKKDFYEYDYDHVSKHVAVQTNEVVSNCFMKTTFIFKPSITGHSIIGKKPKVVYLPFHDITEKRSVKILSVVLECLCFNKLRRTVVICNNMEEVPSVSYAIDIIGNYESVIYTPHLQKKNPNFSKKVKVKKKLINKLNILVTDSKGFSGDESESVIVLVKQDEIYLRHTLVDAISRSTSHLTVLVLDHGYKDILDKNATIANVLNNWTEERVKELKVRIYNNENQPENIDEKVITHECNKKKQLWTRADSFLIICERCKDFNDRGLNKDFDTYKEDKQFRIHDENNSKLETMAYDIQAKTEAKNDTQEIDNDKERQIKREYNRDFLLKFAQIFTFKPQGLPDIDIVLNEAHAPTKALVPGQRLASNDFIPRYMKQAGEGRSSKKKGGRKGFGGGSGASSSGQQKKSVVFPQFEKIELHKSVNAWVPPGELMKDLLEDQREREELARSMRGILNKLTPQKFKSLLDKMKELKIDTKEKLEITIDLIFEKAVNEPLFSETCANLCHCLIDCFKQPKTGTFTPNGIITFKRILLNKCQKEFDNDSCDEKLLEEDISRTFDTEAESKLWKADLDQRKIMNRRRMLGNIRFIGELFKLKMISENIMHDCVIKLLKCEKVESAEDQLECLCILLATIGKDLDHPKAKFRIDQYFAQMSKIIDRKKISTRIKFAIKDIIDLRSCNWVPRRDDSNPKTIDQIHKEAKDEEKEIEKMRQQDKMRPKERGSQRSIGHNSPAMRGGVSGPPSSADGWTNIPSKSKNFPATPVDASKFKIAKKDDSENIFLGQYISWFVNENISLGFRSSWSRGASGGSSRSISGAPASVESVQNKQANRYDVLSEQNPPSGVDSKRGSRGSNTSRSSSGKSSREDRSAAIRAVQDITTMKNQFSKHSRDSPRSGAQTPVETMDAAADVDSTVIEISEEDMRKKTKSTINEYLSIRDTNEAITCLKEVNCSYLHYMFVEEAITIVIEMKSEERKSIGALLHDMIIKNVITVDQLCKGLASIVQNAPDYAVDIPHFYEYLGEVIGPMVYDGALPLNRVKDTLEPLVKPNKAGDVMAEALSVAVQIAGKEESVSELWSKSNIKWEMLLNNDENVDKFIKDKKMEFLMKSTSSNKIHSNNVLKGLLRILQEKGDNNKITSYIDSECSNCKSDPYFIKNLTSMICKSTLVEDATNTRSCNKDELEKRINILLKYIDGNKNLELFALYGIQQLVTTLHHPIGLAIDLFQELYNHDIISEETFFTWESSKEFPDGKGNTISSVKDFLSWLRKAEEESNEEDSTQVFN